MTTFEELAFLMTHLTACNMKEGHASNMLRISDATVQEDLEFQVAMQLSS